jgi:hypothetical protein
MLEAVFKYTHDKTQGYVVVLIVCGLMCLFAAWVAYTNFGPPSKRQDDPES